MPEKVLTCGHALCDICLKIFGLRSHSEKYTYSLSCCLLCGTRNHRPDFQLMPPTAGPRVLSLDGGGIRGVIPLVFLEHIQQEMAELDCPLRDYFDFVCGTSSGQLSDCQLPLQLMLTTPTGGLIILGLFIMQWPPGQCLEKFQDLAGKIFKRRTNGSMLLVRVQDLVLSYLADCRYDSAIIEEAFEQLFGSQLQMFNPLSNDIKVAVTSTTAREALPCLFSNYNGGQRSRETGTPAQPALAFYNDLVRIHHGPRSTARTRHFRERGVSGRPDRVDANADGS